jgi:phospholipid/cholesterol/gamma-HCH transport system substrate-binding protein
MTAAGHAAQGTSASLVATFDGKGVGLVATAGSGDGDGNGQIGRAADSIRRLADDLDKNTNDISAGLSQFSNSGLKEFQAFATDGRHTLAELNKAIKNIDQHPSRLIFGH